MLRWIGCFFLCLAPLFAGPLTEAQKNVIGKKIWQNECAGTVKGLTTWNQGEEFPSLGIAHFIWYPKGFKGRFVESWPTFIEFARKRGAKPPAVALQRFSPWRSRAEFMAEFDGAELKSLRQWLAANVALQTDFVIKRSKDALPKVLAAAPRSERERIEANYHKVSNSSQGIYALIDYVNFKGDGTQVSERYQGRGWGLLQVLGEMKDVPSGAPAAKEFGAAAKRVLSRRIRNSPPERGEKRWEAGWHNRCNSYGKPL
ncbi:MAG: hypothetical protein EAZ42_04035 [Verrucomicrobia bacterium]|nr:MAG: hypothetical protein EAZ42_04035 [Verrucomicrobiota bacterium]